MDIERRREEAELGDKRKARLIEESEVPEFLLAQVKKLVCLLSGKRIFQTMYLSL